MKENHSYANLFPLMSDEERKSLLISIKENGLVDDIWLYQDKILDGRNRYKACLDADIMPRFKTFTGNDEQALKFVLSKNLERRHLTTGQKAMLALTLEEEFGKLAKEKQKQAGGDRKSEKYQKSLVMNSRQAIEEGTEGEKSTRNKAATKAACVVGIGEQSVTRAKTIQEEAPEIAEQVKAGEISLNQGYKMAVHFSSETPEHYTPNHVVKLVLDFFKVDAIDLDPCSNSKENPNFPANRVFTKEDDGLSQTWIADTLFMNPPYGREIDEWVSKLVKEHELGNIKEAIALVPGRIDTQWFNKLYGFIACFITGRLTFIGNDCSAPFPSVLFYLGDFEKDFAKHFSVIGSIWGQYDL